MKSVHVHYFAILREQRGLSRESLTTLGATPADLYEELRARHGFSLPVAQLRVAINGEFAAWSAPLADEAEVVFIPPVAGG